VKVFVSVDLEGVSGVYAEEQTTVGTREYAEACQFLRADVDAAVEGCLQGGATEIVLADGHDVGANVSFQGLPDAVRLAAGSPSPFSMMHGMNETFDAVVLLGYHARAGTTAAVLEHTYTYDIFRVTMGDDLELGEIGLNAGVAGAFGVPVVLVTGDDKAAAEAAALLPGVRCAVVKEGTTRTAAQLYAPDVAHAAIRDGARQALARLASPERPRPLDLSGRPMRVVFTRTGHCDLACDCPGVTRLDARTIEITGADYLRVFDTFVACWRLAHLPS